MNHHLTSHPSYTFLTSAKPCHILSLCIIIFQSNNLAHLKADEGSGQRSAHCWSEEERGAAHSAQTPTGPGERPCTPNELDFLSEIHLWTQ